MRVSDTNNNRGAHGDSSFKLGGMPSSSENPHALAVGSVNIIQKGNPNYPKQIKRFVCKCGCVFEAEKGEYKVDSQYNEEYYACKCPTCGSMVYIG